MEFVNSIARLPSVVNILLAIFVPVIHLVCAVILDVTENNMTSLILDLVVFLCGGIVYWVLNLVYVISGKGFFRFASMLH